MAIFRVTPNRFRVQSRFREYGRVAGAHFLR
jgi:hypothetical protein